MPKKPFASNFPRRGTEMKITYQKPEIVELTGIDGFGDCGDGSGASGSCSFYGNGPQGSCFGNGVMANGSCNSGNLVYD